MTKHDVDCTRIYARDIGVSLLRTERASRQKGDEFPSNTTAQRDVERGTIFWAAER